jgi:hypothetical protein
MMEKHPVKDRPLRMPRASLRLATRPRPYLRASAAEADPQAQLGAPAAVEDDRLPPWREKSLKNRANVMDRTASPWKAAMTAARKGESGRENVNSRCRSGQENGNGGELFRDTDHGQLVSFAIWGPS